MTFESGYFQDVYGDRYDDRTSPAKMAYYLRHIGRLKPAGRLFDMGAAYGTFLGQAALSGYQCEGLEVSEHAAKIARERHPDIPIFNGFIEDYSPTQPFDVVTAFDVLEHVPHLDAAIEKLRSILSIGGILVVVVPVYDTPAGWLVRLLDKDPTHIHKWPRQRWIETLTGHGLKLQVYRGVWRYPLKNRPLHFESVPWFSPAIFTVWSSP